MACVFYGTRRTLASNRIAHINLNRMHASHRIGVHVRVADRRGVKPSNPAPSAAPPPREPRETVCQGSLPCNTQSVSSTGAIVETTKAKDTLH
jgi:hypothetical protein